MKKCERQEQAVMELLKAKRKLTLTEAMEILNVSESTVRRIFIRLEDSGAAVRNYGGIQLIGDHTSLEYLYEEEEGQFVEQKRAIGTCAAGLVENGDILYLDAGTTIAHLCMALTERLAHRELTDISVFTNSLVNLEILSRHITVNIIGGEYRANRRDFCGYLSEELLGKLHFTKCFLGADGFHPQNGFTATDFHTARLNETAIRNADQRFVVTDSRKFATTSMISYSRDQRIDTVITNPIPEGIALPYLTEQQTRIIEV